MSEAVAAMVEWALAQPTIYRVWATCDVDNVASARLLERVGMEREGVLRRWLIHPSLSAAPRDCACYSIVKAGEHAVAPDAGPVPNGRSVRRK